MYNNHESYRRVCLTMYTLYPSDQDDSFNIEHLFSACFVMHTLGSGSEISNS